MPIYYYRCSLCDFSEEILQKISDIPIILCPKCKKNGFEKQIASPAFHLKGSGWYVTDFKNQTKKDKELPKSEKISQNPDKKSEKKTSEKSTSQK